MHYNLVGLLFAIQLFQSNAFCIGSKRSERPIQLFSSTTKCNTDKDGALPNIKVQRFHETFEWTSKDTQNTHKINYKVEGDADSPPILLVHGFGANVNHFRYQFPALTQAGYQVYAVDLLGFGGSDKPQNEDYSIELWVNLLQDFINYADEKYLKKTRKWVVAGNSIGGLCSLGVTAKISDRVCGVILFNCAGGMSIFRYVDPVPIFIRPFLWIVQKFLLSPNGYGGKFFEDFKTRENVERILKTQGVYANNTNVDEELLEILLGPSNDDGAKDVFLKVFGGEAGPAPEQILPLIDQPILAIWGGSDPWTPVDSGFHPGNQFYKFAKGEFNLEIIENCGHCPQDEAPDIVHELMLPWLKQLHSN